MFKKIWQWLKDNMTCEDEYDYEPKENQKRHIINPDQVDHETEMGRQVIAEAFNSGQPIMGHYKEDGTFEIKKLEWPK